MADEEAGKDAKSASEHKSPWTPPASGTPPQAPRTLPLAEIIPFAAGALFGIAVRLLFSGEPGESYAVMLASFIYFAPFLVGAVTVYVAERTERRSWGYYAWSSFVANVLFVLGTMIILIEGLICAVVIAPLFGIVGMFGGLVMGLICRLTDWPKKAICGLGILPLVLGGLEPRAPVFERHSVVERSVFIDAAPEAVWQTIQRATEIRPEEVDSAWMYRIGVPLPVAGVTRETPAGRVRTITMGKSVHFDQVVTEWREARLMRVKYHYAEDSFPSYAMDEHVRLGGHYFDVTDTAYILTPRGQGTELAIQIRYRVSTPFNWYAGPFANVMFGDFEEVILNFYKRRSERTS